MKRRACLYGAKRCTSEMSVSLNHGRINMHPRPVIIVLKQFLSFLQTAHYIKSSMAEKKGKEEGSRSYRDLHTHAADSDQEHFESKHRCDSLNIFQSL